MDSFSLIKCPQFLDNAITPPAKEIGSTLGNIFYLIFSPINYNVEKLKLKHAENLKKYAQTIEIELSKVPEEKLIEPALSIVGPALEASKFFIENEELRQMFAKLIASSMNSDCAAIVHPSFVEIIKQLTPQDASNLKVILKDSFFPIATVHMNTRQNGFQSILEHMFLENPDFTDINSQASSISNLCRLGLIQASYSTHVNDLSRYTVFETNEEYVQLKTHFYEQVTNNPDFNYTSLTLEKGYLCKTPFGDAFIEACIT